MRGNDKPGYTRLIVWKEADSLAWAVYEATRTFPVEERYGVTSQLRRAALSVPTNIVEGAGRYGKRSLRPFVNVALGSLAETEYLLGFCHRLGYLSDQTYEKLDNIRRNVGALLWCFYRSL